jgi:predicted RNA polymerase sigma factor
VAALTRLFGVHNLALAEDVVQDAFSRALKVWQARGVPENPSAWLMATAKNCALDIVRRERTARRFAPELGRLLETEWTLAPLVDEAFALHTIRDEQLRMMFSCCHPQLAVEAQLALILNILCGFGAKEIASVFLTGRAAIEKRISRGKQALAASQRLFDLSGREFETRLATVARALYLLFSEGYHGASEAAVRVELCHEALRLTLLLLENPAAPTRTPEVHALAALICLHAARLPARVDEAGDLSALVDQDRSRWDARLISRWDARLIDQGLRQLELSAAGSALTAYHLEAALAATHASAPTLEQTNWAAVVALYDRLLALAPSPVVALNRAIAIGQRDGAERGLAALAAISGAARLERYPFYAAAFAELELRRGNAGSAAAHFERALSLARNGAERRFLEKRLAACARL